jgi:polysaccharide deacetylase family protein (PEP-CTERM system associated)
MTTVHNALTVDVEEWFHPELVRSHLPHGRPQSQIEQATLPLLDLFAAKGVKATFFVVGEVARSEPLLVQRIVDEGHELACHGMTHRPLWQMSADELRADLVEFSRVMRELVPASDCIGFRAPTFSLDSRTTWALRVLEEAGYRYDSSVFPMRTPLYGVAGAPVAPYRPCAEDLTQSGDAGSLVEFPISVWSWAGIRLPVCGGFYLRALPFSLVRTCLLQISSQRPLTIYFHPWETYRGTPRLPLPLASRWATYHNIDKMMERLEKVLDTFSFAPMRTVLAERGDLL